MRGLFLFFVLLSGLQLHAAFQQTPLSISVRKAHPGSPLFSPRTKLAESVDTSEDDLPSKPSEKSAFAKLKGWVTYGQKFDDGLTFRQRLKSLGLMTVVSYTWVSNMSYGVGFSCAWYIFSKRTGLSPLAPDQWAKFLGVYAGFFVFNNIIRPLRLALSVAVSPVYEKFVNTVQRKTKLPRGVAVGLVAVLPNVVGVSVLMCLGISLASLAAGVPIFPPK